MKKILVTGASGFVGSRFVQAMQSRYSLLTPGHREFDITSAEAVNSYMDANRPDAILHLAAISNTGYCEEHPEESHLVNVVGVENLATAARRHEAKFIFFSSDQVYNGNSETGLLDEALPVSPENHYGRHKLLAEQRATEIYEATVALRATWMYDAPREGMPTHRNFIINIKEAIENDTTLRLATREYRGITHIDEVISNLPHTLTLKGGVYNFGAENTLNTYETALAYLDILQYRGKEIISPDTARFPEHIRNISISMKKTREASGGAIQFSTTIEGLKRFEGR